MNVLFLDVDGPLTPYGAGTSFQRTWAAKKHTWPSGQREWTSKTLSARLLALTAQIVWATTWALDVNDADRAILETAYGFPVLPKVDMDRYPDLEIDRHGREYLNSGKRHAITAWLNENPPATDAKIVWIDDHLSATDRETADGWGLETLLIRPFSAGGLTPKHLTDIEEFLG
jgi:HAD domain in Swiss Army Knife RNA repair proteins